MTPPGAPAGGSASFSSTLRACHAATLPTAAQKCRHSGRAWCWAAVEAAMLPRSNSWLKSDYHRIAACRGKKIAAGGRRAKILILVFHGLRDGRSPLSGRGRRGVSTARTQPWRVPEQVMAPSGGRAF